MDRGHAGVDFGGAAGLHVAVGVEHVHHPAMARAHQIGPFGGIGRHPDDVGDGQIVFDREDRFRVIGAQTPRAVVHAIAALAEAPFDDPFVAGQKGIE